MPGRLPLRSEPPLGGWPGHARTAGALTQPQPGRCPPSRAWQTLAAPRPQDAPPATPSEQRGSQPGPRAQGTGLPRSHDTAGCHCCLQPKPHRLRLVVASIFTTQSWEITEGQTAEPISGERPIHAPRAEASASSNHDSLARNVQSCSDFSLHIWKILCSPWICLTPRGPRAAVLAAGCHVQPVPLPRATSGPRVPAHPVALMKW
ncbi:cortexin domain-containing 1 protein isoform X1 [Rhinolophus sinicus]|uniref:cortexin domain-containing 1 protein isoform X1 n=1 Tax=Rhinolophus sinicus TaxID=89399 RepID=UPI003D792D43